MDFQLSEDQIALRDGIRSFCEGTVPVEQLAELEKKKAFDRGLWGELAEMGVFSLRLPEADGGVGLGMADAVLVFAEMGRRLVPGPLAWSHLLAPHIDGAGSGERVVGGLDLVDGGSNEPVLVEHLESLDVLVALRADGVYQIDPRALEAKAVGVPLDPLTPLHHVPNLPRGERIADAETVATMRLEGAVLVAAQQLGIAEATLELANEYAKGREQFGRAIGGFQAVKHMLADMFVKQEAARAGVYAAGATIDDPVVGSIPRAVAAAKITANDAALANGATCIQVHGGMGYTWEVPAHYYWKRAHVYEGLFGDGDEHAERMAELLDQDASA